jgi:hypothetical protein
MIERESKERIETIIRDFIQNSPENNLMNTEPKSRPSRTSR